MQLARCRPGSNIRRRPNVIKLTGFLPQRTLASTEDWNDNKAGEAPG
jgi:hypothetical protein